MNKLTAKMLGFISARGFYDKYNNVGMSVPDANRLRDIALDAVVEGVVDMSDEPAYSEVSPDLIEDAISKADVIMVINKIKEAIE